MRFKKGDERTRLCGIAGRLTQIRNFTIPTYQTADGDLSNRDSCILHGKAWVTKAGNIVVQAFIVDPDLKDRYKLRTIRLDRIIRTGGLYFYAKGRRFKSWRERQVKTRARKQIVGREVAPF